MKFEKNYIIPTCPGNDRSCFYYDIKDGKCHMYEKEGRTPYLECEYWEGSDEAKALMSIECNKGSN